MEISVRNVPERSNWRIQTHPLGHRWTLWFDNPSNRNNIDNFGDTLQIICTFDTVEEFWRVQHNITQPSSLEPNSDIHLFKEGLVPKWEDPNCERGGRWIVNLPKSNVQEMTNKIWLNALLSCIGEMFEFNDEICGVACNIRFRENRVCLWTRDSSNQKLQTEIGRQFKHLVGLGVHERISYLAHSDAMRMGSSNSAVDSFFV